MQNYVKKAYLKSTNINPYISVHLFENETYFGVEVFQNDKLYKRNQYKKEKYDSPELCYQKAEARYNKHIQFITKIIKDSQFIKL